MKCGNVTNGLSLLCGKLAQENQQIGIEMTDSVAKDLAASSETDLNRNDESSLQDDGIYDIYSETTGTSIPNINRRSSTTEETPTIDGSHRATDASVPVDMDISMDQSDTEAEEEEENVPQSTNTQKEVVRLVDGLLAKAAKLLPSTNSTAPDGNSLCLPSEGEATSVQAAENCSVCILPTKNLNSVVGMKLPREKVSFLDNVSESNSDFAKTPVNIIEDIQISAKSEINNNPVYTEAAFPPAFSTGASNSQPAENSTTRPAVPPTWNTVAVNNQPTENSSVYTQPAVLPAFSTAAANNQRTGNISVYTQPAVPPALSIVPANNKPAENSTVYSQPAVPLKTVRFTINH